MIKYRIVYIYIQFHREIVGVKDVEKEDWTVISYSSCIIWEIEQGERRQSCHRIFVSSWYIMFIFQVDLLDCSASSDDVFIVDKKSQEIGAIVGKRLIFLNFAINWKKKKINSRICNWHFCKLK